MKWLSLLGGDEWLARARAAAKEGSLALEDRVELALLEWQETRRRLVLVWLLSLLSAVLALVALTVGSIAVMVHFWDSGHRVVAAWSVAGFWLVALLASAGALYAVLRQGQAAFELTRQELARDWALLKESL